MMSTLYDAEQAPLAGQIAIDNHEFTTSDTPDHTFIHPIECASKESPLTIRYVQSSNSPQLNDDERFNDVGIFQISTIGMPAAADGQPVGELWATYDITFLKPALPDIHAGTSALFNLVGGATGELLVSAAGQALWDESGSYPVTVIDNTTLQLPVSYAGTYQMTITVQLPVTSTTISRIADLVSFGSDITRVSPFAGQSATAVPGSENSDMALAYGNVMN
jgi:hypothetical protein